MSVRCAAGILLVTMKDWPEILISLVPVKIAGGTPALP
jgi:hypothetical protein